MKQPAMRLRRVLRSRIRVRVGTRVALDEALDDPPDGEADENSNGTDKAEPTNLCTRIKLDRNEAEN
jgi:hypothetical protein